MTYATEMKKSAVHGWQATSESVLEETPKGQRILKLSTSKTRGGIAATATVCIRQQQQGYATETYALFEDFHKSGIAATPNARATEKAVRQVHALALMEMDSLIVAAKAHYAPKAEAA